MQTFKGLSSLNSAYINNNGAKTQAEVQMQPKTDVLVQQPQIKAGQPLQTTQAQNQFVEPLKTTQGYAPEMYSPRESYQINAQNPILNPNTAYIEGVGAVPSGYFIEAEKAHGSEDHIVKKTPLTGARIVADKLTKGVLSYAPKGMQGSKNSNFYEYLSLGMIPYIVGSGMMIATTIAATKFFNPNDARASKMMGKGVALGVAFYAVMKWLGGKVMEKGTEAVTGVDMAMPYKKIISELPENGEAKVATEFHRVFESVDFPRWDLINKQGEENGNRYEYYDKIAKEKLGCEEQLNAPDQVVQPLIKNALVRAMAAKSVSSFLWAATGVAIAAQEAFRNFGYRPKQATFIKRLKDFPKEFGQTLVKAAKQLWKGSSTSSKLVGRGLIIGAAASTILGLLNVKRGFKIDSKPSQSRIDYKKDYVEN